MGGFCLGGFCPRGDFVQGDFVRGILSGGFCPGDYVLELCHDNLKLSVNESLAEGLSLDQIKEFD